MKESILSIHEPLRIIGASIGDTHMIPEVIDSMPNEISLLHSLYDSETGKVIRRKEWFKKRNAADPHKPLDGPYPNWLYPKK